MVDTGCRRALISANIGTNIVRMTTPVHRDRSHESVINDVLARLLRESLGLSAVAETLHEGKRPDVLIRLPAGPVILETEVEPAPTVEADALSRLGMEIDGQRVQNVFAVTIPGHLRSTAQQRLYERMAVSTLEWREWRIDGSAGPGTHGNTGGPRSRCDYGCAASRQSR